MAINQNSENYLDYNKAFTKYENSKKLYYYTPSYIELKKQVIEKWRTHVSFDALEFEFPLLVPRKVLEESEHLSKFGDQVFEVHNLNLKPELCLRPETASSIFPHFKQLKIKYKKKKMALKISQVGKAFRNQNTTRDRHYRLKEFDQAEIEILEHNTKEPEQFFNEYERRLHCFFKSLSLDKYITKTELSKQELPHYAKKTIDFHYKDPLDHSLLEIGCLSNRGNHDLKYLEGLSEDVIFECSLGLTRIILIILKIKNSCLNKNF